MSADAPDLVYDCETVSPEWGDLDETTRLYLADRALRSARRAGEACTADDAEQRAADRLGLEMGLARPAAIGVCNVDTGDVAVLLEQRGDAAVPDMWIEDGAKIYPLPEPLLLRRWWAWAPQYARLITFNGRGYDGPMLHIRSAQLGIPCTRDLVGYRYDIEPQCDMSDVLGFQGALSGGYGLEYWCLRFGLESPKVDGVDGKAVQQLYRDGRMREIAAYVARDVRRSRELYLRLRASFLWTFKGGPAIQMEPQLELERAG